MVETVYSLEDLGDGQCQLTTSTGTIFNEGAVIIAAEFGVFEPKRPPLNELDIYECLGHGA
jgi:thioredoxin reductase (NADPH)